jgi:inorganic pyrophosphatase/exopolyphosphatase
MKSVITSYVNPDLDGVACAIVLAATEEGGWIPRMSGHLDEETRHVLAALTLEEPEAVTSWSDVARVWLVDTHHPAQLPQELPFDRVLHVTDHHTGGEPAAFPNADIHNESVGAAATLVAEQAMHKVSPQHAILLQCAILSNTLEFRAPATSTRDRIAFDALHERHPVESALRAGMRAMRNAVLRLATAELLQRDVKRFPTPAGVVAVSQIEAEGALGLLDRDDLARTLRDLVTNTDAVAAVLNVVDPSAARSAILTTWPFLTNALAAALGTRVRGDGALLVERVLQRKTDIVPTLLTLHGEGH